MNVYNVHCHAELSRVLATVEDNLENTCVRQQHILENKGIDQFSYRWCVQSHNHPP